ncbi:hypothetical protein HKX48_005667 [Thoreauomyces humboldtii]|nr:hypothetical protein HKX48_005667 [Thoreauomyces humboldtii]
MCRSKHHIFSAIRRGRFTPEENAAILEIRDGKTQLEVVARKLGRPAAQVYTQLHGQLSPVSNRDRFTDADDVGITRLHASYLESYGQVSWKLIAHEIGRTAMATRSRWTEFLDPSLKKGPWTAEEDAAIIAHTGRSSDLARKLSRGSQAVRNRAKSLERLAKRTGAK